MSNTPPLPERFDSLELGSLQFVVPAGVMSEADFQPNYMDKKQTCAESPTPTAMEVETPNFFRESYNTLNTFYSKEALCDVTIECGSKSFKCHRLILAIVSGYFRSMFLGTMSESKQDVVKIKEIDENVLEDMIRYAYSGKIQITVDNVQSILYVASILQIEDVAKACSDFMKEHLSSDNCVQVHTFAMLHNREQLINSSQSFITENFLDVSKTTEFLSMPANIIESIVDSDRLNVSNEIEVFEAVMSWINHDPEDRKQHLTKLMSKIKVCLIKQLALKKFFFLNIETEFVNYKIHDLIKNLVN